MDVKELFERYKESEDYSGHDSFSIVIPNEDYKEFLITLENVIKNDESYWKKRCLAAENYINNSPCDSVITLDQIKAHAEWRNIVDNEKQ